MVSLKLIAIDGPVKGTTFPLVTDEVWIGRDTVNHIQLSDPMVSRRHCRISLEGDSLKLRDENSSNGTLVNDVRCASDCSLTVISSRSGIHSFSSSSQKMALPGRG